MWGVVRVWPSGRGEGGGDVGGDAAVLPTAFQVGRAPRLPPPCPFFFALPRLHQTLPTTHRPLPSPPLSSPTVRGRRGGRGANAGGGRWGADAAPPRRHLTASAGGRGRASATVAKTHGGSSPPLGVGAAHAPKYFRAIPWRRPGGHVGERVSAVTPPPIVHSSHLPPPPAPTDQSIATPSTPTRCTYMQSVKRVRGGTRGRGRGRRDAVFRSSWGWTGRLHGMPQRIHSPPPPHRPSLPAGLPRWIGVLAAGTAVPPSGRSGGTGGHGDCHG